jgi:hypothetical protein
VCVCESARARASTRQLQYVSVCLFACLSATQPVSLSACLRVCLRHSLSVRRSVSGRGFRYRSSHGTDTVTVRIQCHYHRHIFYRHVFFIHHVRMCVRACACVCVRACVRDCVVCISGSVTVLQRHTAIFDDIPRLYVVESPCRDREGEGRAAHETGM